MTVALPEAKEPSQRALLACLPVLLVPLLAAGPAVTADDSAAGTVAAVFSPAAGTAEIAQAVAAADGRLVRDGALPFIRVVHGEGPGFAGRLRAAGAWLVLDPVVAAGCLGLAAS